MSNLKTVLNQLASDKIKERHEGIAALRTTFSQNRAVERLDADGRGQTWLVVFQALFKAVVAEKVLYDRKPGDTAERRLREAASAVRWLTERVVDRLNRKVSMNSTRRSVSLTDKFKGH
jgi:ataxia telangiectasia mutated family protein